MDLKEFAEQELGESNGEIAANVRELIDVLAKQDHIAMTLELTLTWFDRLARWQPITPLTGEESEWGPADDDPGQTRQNKRCPAVFLDKDGTTTMIHGRIWEDASGTAYTDHRSAIPVTFPFMPPLKPKYIKLDENNVPLNWCKDFGDVEEMVLETRCYKDPDTMQGLLYAMLALAGETGEVADQVKRISRDDDDKLTPERRGKIIKELGDVAFCLVACIREISVLSKANGMAPVSFEDVLNISAHKMFDRKRKGTLHGEGDDR